MIKEIICVDIGKTIYVVSTDKDEYYYINTKQRKIVIFKVLPFILAETLL